MYKTFFEEKWGEIKKKLKKLGEMSTFEEQSQKWREMRVFEDPWEPCESSIMLAKYFPFLQLHVEGIQIKSFSHTWCFLHSHQRLSLFNHWSELHFLPLKLNLHSHDTCFANVFDSFIPVIMPNTLGFKSSVLFGIHALLDKSLIILQLLAHLSN